MAENMITVEKLFKQYGKGENAVQALKDISFSVRKGEFVAVTGESGSGKTTLLNVLGSLITADEGHIIVDGKDITKYNDSQLAAYRRQKIGIIFQNYNLIQVLNAEENICLPMNLDSAQPDMAFLEELLELTGLKQKRNRFPHELSGGEQQKISFARALIHKPDIILADEPTGNLDTKNSRELISVLKNSIRKYRQTLILITHDLSIAAQADRIFVMKDGVLTEEDGVNKS